MTDNDSDGEQTFDCPCGESFTEFMKAIEHAEQSEHCGYGFIVFDETDGMKSKPNMYNLDSDGLSSDLVDTDTISIQGVGEVGQTATVDQTGRISVGREYAGKTVRYAFEVIED